MLFVGNKGGSMIGKSAVYVFGIWFGVSAIIAAIKYYVNKD